MEQNKKNLLLKKQNIFYLIFLLFIMVNISLVFHSRLLPMNDLPQHLAFATITRHINNPGNYFDQYYKIYPFFLKWNTLHPFFCSLKFWPSVEFANKIFISLYIILLPTSVLYLIQKFKGNKWLSLLSFLLIYNFNFIWGFVGYFFAIPLCFFLIGINIDYLRKISIQSVIAIPIFILLIYHSHILPMVFITGLLFLQNLVYNRSNIKKFVIKSIPYLIGVGLFIYFYYFFTNIEIGTISSLDSLQESVKPNNRISWLNNVFLGKLYYLFLSNFAYYSFNHGKIISLFFSTMALIFLFFNQKNKSVQQLERILILYSIIFYFIVYLLFPGNKVDWQRITVFFFLLIIVYSGISIKSLSKPTISLIVVACIAYFGLAADYFVNYNIENKDFNKQLFKGIPKDKVLSGLVLNNKFRNQPKLMHHLPDYHIVWNKGIETLKLGDGYPHYQIKRKVSKKILPAPQWTVGLEKVYYGAQNSVDFLLIRGSLNDFYDDHSKNIILNKFQEIRRQGKWILFKNKQLD